MAEKCWTCTQAERNKSGTVYKAPRRYICSHRIESHSITSKATIKCLAVMINARLNIKLLLEHVYAKASKISMAIV